ncbi:MAG: hypothetical protein P8Z50_06295, partial [candidate division WOR-3 bacterium]
MIQLGKISLKNKNYLVEKRNKVLGLLEDLGFGEVSATRLTTAISEIMWEISGMGDKCWMEFFIDNRKGMPGLLIRF